MRFEYQVLRAGELVGMVWDVDEERIVSRSEFSKIRTDAEVNSAGVFVSGLYQLSASYTEGHAGLYLQESVAAEGDLAAEVHRKWFGDVAGRIPDNRVIGFFKPIERNNGPARVAVIDAKKRQKFLEGEIGEKQERLNTGNVDVMIGDSSMRYLRVDILEGVLSESLSFTTSGLAYHDYKSRINLEMPSGEVNLPSALWENDFFRVRAFTGKDPRIGVEIRNREGDWAEFEMRDGECKLQRAGLLEEDMFRLNGMFIENLSTESEFKLGSFRDPLQADRLWETVRDDFDELELDGKRQWDAPVWYMRISG